MVASISGPIAATVVAQTNCDSVGPDIMIAELTGPLNYASLNGIEAFSAGHRVCNIGDAPIGMFINTNDHAVYGKSLYKLTRDPLDGTTRFEQLGQSWLLHGFFSLSGDLCCTDCQPTDGTTLGIHCADANTAARSGSQSTPGCGPKWQINPVTGAFPYPPANPPWSGPVARRLQARIAELFPSGPNVSYFVEGVVISADDALAGNGKNNASYRPVTLTGSGSVWDFGLTGETVRELPAIYAWAAADPSVRIATIDIPEDGYLVIAGRTNPVAGSVGFWHYEYAVYNLNSARAVRAVSIELPANVVGTNAGFHDVDYHSGDGPGNVNYDGTDWVFHTWPAPRMGRWETQTHEQNPSANALCWGTLYNFRFDVQAPPRDGAMQLELFTPGTPASASVESLPVPGLRSGDTNGDGVVDLSDLADLLSSYGLCEGDDGFLPIADFDRDGCVSLSDLALLLAMFGQ